MADTEYEILPHQLLNDLKYDVEALKKKLTEPDAKSNELILEIESLKDSIHELTIIFQKALEETKEEDSHLIIKKLNEKIQSVVSQNETIARGMVAISDKLEEFMKPQSEVVPVQNSSFNTGLASPSFGSGLAPPSPMDHGLPPPPRESRKRKLGLF